MNYVSLNKALKASALLVLMGVVNSCQKDLTAPLIVDGDASTTSRAVYSTRTVNFNSYSPNTTYTEANASSDFGNLNGAWPSTRTYISNKNLRVTLLANDLGSSGGIIRDVDITDGQEYSVTFDVRFHTDFDWSRGGKIGFGFKLGDGNEGCDKANDGNGGSARVMWTTNNNSKPPRFKPYVYYVDMQDNCGDDFGKTYPAGSTLEKGVWYTVKIFIRSNTASNYDGKLKYTINGTEVLNVTNMRWTTNSAKRLINRLMVNTYRGGSTADWESGTIGYVYFDNISWKPSE